MPKAKPYSGAVDPKLVAQLFKSTGVTIDEVPLGEALEEARLRLADVVERANKSLDSSDFAPIMAEHLANKLGRRGHAQIRIADSGDVFLDITYDETQAGEPAPKPKRVSTVPLMDALKAKAKELGVDISEFGIKRKKIHAFLQKVEAGEVEAGEIEPEPKAKPKSELEPKPKPKAKPKPEIKTANDAPEDDLGPMSAGPDETRVSAPPDDVKPPKKGFVKTSQAVSSPVVVDMQSAVPKSTPSGANSAKSQEEAGKGRSMRDLVKDADGVDIADLLMSDPPK